MMIDPRLMALAACQDDLVAVWQLTGWTPDQIRHRTAGFQRVHDGVLRIGRAPLTERQRRRAATLTTPTTVLGFASAGAHDGYWRQDGGAPVVIRPGRGGPVMLGGCRPRTASSFRTASPAPTERLLVTRSTCLTEEDIIRDGGPPRTTPARTLIDLAPHVTDRQLRKAFREALRLRRGTAAEVRHAADRHRRRHGVARVRTLADRYVRLPIDRCRSDAEAMALELLDAAGRPIPRVNAVVAGEEADQWFPELRRVIEIDSRGFHQLKDDDARKTAAWRAAGLRVDRISSDDVFDHPDRYLALAPARRDRGAGVDHLGL
jgi:hypothetical protein